jgi:DHA2 family multidrug resistance protein
LAEHQQTRSAAGDRSPWLIAVVVSIATFMQVLDTSIANVALRHIAGSLAAGIDENTWIITTYLVASAVIVPISAWLMGVIGRKRFYMLCVALFTASSLLCGLAPSLGMLIFFRVLQGLGGGGMVPSEQAILADTFPPERRAQAFALYGIAVIVVPTIGPTIGGWITDNWSWHWIFFVNVPIGIVSLVLVQWLVVEPAALERERREQLAGGCISIGAASSWSAYGWAASRSCSTRASAKTGSSRTSSSALRRRRRSHSCCSCHGSSPAAPRSSI